MNLLLFRVYGINSPVEDALMSIAADDLCAKFGDESAADADPVSVEISPYCIDEPGFVIRSWHQLKDYASAGGFQLHEFSFGLESSGQGLIAQTDRQRRHILSGESTIFLTQLAVAAKNTSASSLPQC